MRALHRLLLIPLLLAGGALLAEEARPTREQIEKDLELRAVLKTPAVIQHGERVELDLALRNRSQTATHLAVIPGDGSDVGWREPHVYYTATVDTGDGRALPVQTMNYGRCGLFDFDWQKDARALKPGKEFAMKDWLRQPSEALEFLDAGRVRLVAHYHYRQGVMKGGQKQEVTGGPMLGVPAFDIVSAPVEFEVVRPLDVAVTVKKSPIAGNPVKFSDLLDIRLTNRTKESREIHPPTFARLALQVLSSSHTPERAEFRAQQETQVAPVTVKPGEDVSLIGGGPFANGMNGTWTPRKADTLKIRAVYTPTEARTELPIYSKWAEIKVAE